MPSSPHASVASQGDGDRVTPALLLAGDCGKTGCRLALWQDGAVIATAEGAGAPGLAVPGGTGLTEAAVLAVASRLLGGRSVQAACIAVAGAMSAGEAALDLARRFAESLQAGQVAVCSDAIANHAGALGGEPGVVLAVGTGAVAVGIGPDGALRRGDGWGPWLGDEGGGGWIGRQGLRAALRAWDKRGVPTALLDAAVRQFGDLAGLPGSIEGQANPAAFAAAFAPAVAEAAEAGDAVACALMDEAADHLAEAALAAKPSGVAELALTGGLVALTALSGRVSERLQAHFHAVPALGTALDGAALLARRDTLPHEPFVIRVTRGAPAHRLDRLATEGMRPGLDDLDLRPPGAVVRLALEAEAHAQAALARAAPALADAADAVAARMRAGGRLFYLGAGTSGRLATLDAAELGPTYSAPPGLVVPLLAGGPAAMTLAAEGAEDDTAAPVAALDGHGLAAGDAVVGIAASGRTPFVVAGLAHARSRGALTVAIVNNAASPAAAAAEHAVEILTGPEIVAGSTRMTAGTTQKIALNALSTAVMVSLGRTYGARMVDVRATNAKLHRRALRMVQEITGAAQAEAAAALEAAGGRVKPALVMLLAGVDAAAALRRLDAHGGRVRAAIVDPG